MTIGNAISKLKTIATFVTETNYNDGVAQFLVEKGIIAAPASMLTLRIRRKCRLSEC